MVARLDITLQRNQDWSRYMRLTDAGLPIDLTNSTLAMYVRERVTRNLIAQADITVNNPASGEADVLLRASESSPLGNYGVAIQPANLLYDMRLTYPDGVHEVLFGGDLILLPGQTRP